MIFVSISMSKNEIAQRFRDRIEQDFSRFAEKSDKLAASPSKE